MKSKTPFKSSLKQRYKTLKAFAESHNISVPTAMKYWNEPLTMNLGMFYRIAIHMDVSVIKLHELIFQEYGTKK